MKRNHITDCYNYTLNRLRELSSSYEEQVKNIEDYALWNLPGEFAENWCNMKYFIDILYSNRKIDDKIKQILDEINDNFEKCPYEEVDYDSKIWTHESLKKSEFWNRQRNLAKQAIELILNKK